MTQILQRTHFAAGKTIFRAGDPGNAAYLIESGVVDIQRTIGGKPMPIASLTAGEIFGEMALVDGSRRMADAVVGSDATLIVVPLEQFDERLRNLDPFMRALVRMFVENLRTMTKSALIAQAQNEALRAKLKSLGLLDADPAAGTPAKPDTGD